MTAFLLWVRSFPSWAWAVLAVLALAGGLYLKGRSDGKEACQRAQEAAEARADAKAADVAKRAQERAEKATAKIQKEVTDDRERAREIVAGEPATCPPMPDELRDILRRRVEAARTGVPAG